MRSVMYSAFYKDQQIYETVYDALRFLRLLKREYRMLL